MKDNNIASLKKQISTAIENQDFQKVEQLSEELGALLNLDESDCEMPEDFLLRIKRNNREKKNMNMKKIVIRSVAAAAIIVIAVSGGVIAHNLKIIKMKNLTILTKEDGTKDGYLIYDKNGDMNCFFINEDGSGTLMPGTCFSADRVWTSDEELTEQDKNIPKYPERGGYDSITSEKPEKNDVWLSKEIINYPGYEVEQEDGEIHFTPRTLRTYYEYENLESLMIDQNFYNIFAKFPDVNHHFTFCYNEFFYWETPEKVESVNCGFIETFKYGNGHINLDVDLGDPSSDLTGIAWGLKNISNVREYTAANGQTYQLVDVSSEGKSYTKLLVGHESDIWKITFKDLTEDEIHEFIDMLK